MITELKAPEEIADRFPNNRSKVVFLAGGITKCVDWQNQFINLAEEKSNNEANILFINPRYSDYSYTEEKERLQVIWEAKYMDMADAVLFWFTPPTLNPITLFELGKFINTSKKLFIGIHPNYEKKNNVLSQMFYHQSLRESIPTTSIFEELSALDSAVVSNSTEHLLKRVLAWENNFSLGK